MDYSEFLATKRDYGAARGFAPTVMPDVLFDFQKHLVDWSVRMGRDAIFADCGMGKTIMQLVWAQNVVAHTNRPVLILAPLAVTSQTVDEAEKFGIEARKALPDTRQTCIQVTNYERLHQYDAADFAGCVCDESSILKSFNGTRKSEITEFMRRVPYRLLCTATAAPNDWIELGTSSEALGYLGHMDMLTRFFTNKHSFVVKGFSRFGRDKWQIRPHAIQPFWRWVASWARAARRPSDLGFDDDGFILPPMRERHTDVEANRPPSGMLFDVPAITWREEREAIRRTIPERCEAAAKRIEEHNLSVAWCHLNDESSTLAKLIPGAVEVTGSDSEDAKEEAVRWFVHGTESRRVLVTKPRILGFGLNFQHAAHMTYFPTHSYEQYYQATRRLWRFGQSREVTVDLIYTNGGSRMMANLARKAEAADKMFDQLVRHMNDAVTIKETYTPAKVEVPQWMGAQS